MGSIWGGGPIWIDLESIWGRFGAAVVCPELPTEPIVEIWGFGCSFLGGEEHSLFVLYVGLL